MSSYSKLIEFLSSCDDIEFQVGKSTDEGSRIVTVDLDHENCAFANDGSEEVKSYLLTSVHIREVVMIGFHFDTGGKLIKLGTLTHCETKMGENLD